MTIQGAIEELQILFNAKDIPIYYKGAIKKVIETIQMDTVPKNFHDKTCEAMAKRHTEEMQRYMWIPCSERLPEENGRYLVTYPLLINKPWISILWYGRPTFPETDHPCFYASDDEYGDVEYNDVIAWAPLPEPYKEGE